MEEVAWIQFTHFDRGVLAFVPYCLGTQMRSRFQSHKKGQLEREERERVVQMFAEVQWAFFSLQRVQLFMVLILCCLHDYCSWDSEWLFPFTLHLSVSFPFFLFLFIYEIWFSLIKNDDVCRHHCPSCSLFCNVLPFAAAQWCMLHCAWSLLITAFCHLFSAI